jgi:predicted exporter
VTPRRLPLAAALLAAVLLTVVVFALVPVRSDMTELLPEGRTEAARLMLRELRTGTATSVILAGIEGAPEGTLTGISDRLAQALADDGRFAFVQNGRGVLGEAEVAALFARRYLLSPATAFDIAALRRDFETLLDGLQSSASPLVQQFGLPDPTGAFASLIAAWTGASRVRSVQGVWFAADAQAPRALLLIRTRATGMDLAAQDTAIAAVQRAFSQAKGDAPARLLLAGPAVFARDAAAAIRDDVRLISIASIVLVAGLLLWRFRSPWVLAAIAMPVLLGLSAAAVITALRFGFVHGITLGFGMTMLGVTVDYPVLLVGHRKQHEPAAGTLARIGATFTLAVLTAAIGLSGMVFSGVPGVAQFGLFAVAGLLAAAAATRFLLPRLIVAAGLAPVEAGDPALLRRVERWRRFRPAGLAVAAAAAGMLAWHGGPAWQHDLGALTPIPAADLALDAELRGQLGAPEPGQLAVLRGASEEEVLQHEEALRPALDRLAAQGAIGGVEMAANLLPSAALQRARQAALPDAATLAARVAQAAAGLGFAPAAFDAFEADIAASRGMAPVRRADLDNPLLAARLDALLVPRDGGWLGLIAPRAVRDPASLAAALAGLPGAGLPGAGLADVVFVDIGQETSALAGGYARGAWPLLAAGATGSVLCLAVALRDLRRVARVLAAIAAALLVTVAALTLAGVRLSLIHLVSLQFVAGVGLDYALFFARAQVDEEERARTLRTLVTCVAMALLTFGLLSLCRTPLLAGIGVTVAVGVACAMGFAFLLAGPKVAA